MNALRANKSIFSQYVLMLLALLFIGPQLTGCASFTKRAYTKEEINYPIEEGRLCDIKRMHPWQAFYYDDQKDLYYIGYINTYGHEAAVMRCKTDEEGDRIISSVQHDDKATIVWDSLVADKKQNDAILSEMRWANFSNSLSAWGNNRKPLPDARIPQARRFQINSP